MSYVFSLMEAIIASYMMCEYCEVKKKNIFFFICLLLTFLVELVSDTMKTNFLPLSIVYILLWTILMSFFVEKKYYLYILFVACLTNVIIDISLILPVSFIYKYNYVLAGFIAKLNQFILTYLFVKYHQKFAYLRNRYWLVMICVLTCCAFLIDVNALQIIENTYISRSVLTIILSFLIIMISLFFFSFIEQATYEKERVTKELEKKKYQNITYDMMKHSQDELNRLEHLLTYQLLLIKNEIENDHREAACQMIDNVIDKAKRINHTVYSGNSLLDSLLALKFNDLDYMITPCIVIPCDPFYDNIQFIHFIFEVLENIQSDKLNFILKEDGYFCIIQFISDCHFISKETIKKIIKKYNDFIIHYHMTTNNGITILNIEIGKEK